MSDWSLVFALGAATVLACGVGFLVMAAFPLSRRAKASIFSDAEDGAVFLFDGEQLIDASAAGMALLSRSGAREAPYFRLMLVLEPHFPRLKAQISRLPVEGVLTLTSAPQKGVAMHLHAEQRGGLVRISVQDTAMASGLAGPDPMIHRAMTDEVERLRSVVGHAPLPLWRERGDGDVIWANTAYVTLARAQLDMGEDLNWPLPRLFDHVASVQGAAGQRQKLAIKGGDPAWFDLVGVDVDDGGQGDRLVYALPADVAARAELALREFRQTLTQTFAHLPIGLAVFDRRRQLHMFNPALIDLTGLPADFLALRPSLLSVLDALRDSKMLPEPKDYRGWRRQIVDLEKAAAAGLYEDTWTLANGQTFRVLARPHPNGGLALLIEDISTETFRSRRYRSELELGQSVIDAMDEAVAVFAQDGRLVMTNPAYEALWGRDPGLDVSGEGFRLLCADWRAATAPSPLWDEIEAGLAALAAREPWAGEARLTDGRPLRCRFAPLAGGAVLVGFRIPDPVLPVIAETGGATALRDQPDKPRSTIATRHSA